MPMRYIHANISSRCPSHNTLVYPGFLKYKAPLKRCRTKIKDVSLFVRDTVKEMLMCEFLAGIQLNNTQIQPYEESKS